MAVKAKTTITLVRVDDGSDGKGVSKTEIYYYRSTSSTTQTGGAWVSSPPEWVNGTYFWQKIKTTFTDGTTSESKPVCITGEKGNSGAVGTSVSSITTEFYLSDSKTQQTGGQWDNTMPKWSPGKYLWTRSKIIYINPSSTKYTSPICDSSWEAVNEIEVGGRNLVLKSNVDYTNADYLMASYQLNKIDSLAEGDIVTIQIKGTLGSDKTHFAVYSDDKGKSLVTNITKANEKGVYCATVPWTYTKHDGSTGTPAGVMNLYAAPSSGLSESSVDWVKIEKGNIATDWTPAPEDIDNEFDEVNDSIINQNTNITSTINSILMSALKTYTKTNDFEEFKTTISSQLELLANELTIKFTETNESLNKANGDLQRQLNTITKYFTFNANGLIIGQVDNPYKVIIDNDRYSMTVNNVEVMWIANGKVYTPELEVTKEFKILDYMLHKDNFGNVNCDYIGT